MMRVIVYLSESDHDALIQLAQREYRPVRDQAAQLICEGLRWRADLLAVEPTPAELHPARVAEPVEAGRAS